MDSLFANPTDTISIVLTLALALFYFVDRRKSGQDTIKESTIAAYKLQVEQLQSAQQTQREESAALKETISELTRAVGHLEGINGEKDKQIENLTKLVQGRNPEMLTLLNEMKNLMAQVVTAIKQNAEDMQQQTKLLEANRQRYEQIDMAHGAAVK